MTARAKGIAVLAVQVALVLSIAGKYAWERHTSPRVWTRTFQYDPERPLRGRYLALSLEASACGLAPPGKANGRSSYGGYRYMNPSEQVWTVVPAVRDGKLAPTIKPETQPGETEMLTLPHGVPCDRARLSSNVEFFISEKARTPFPLQPGQEQEVWAEVTVPPQGPPRPVQLAISDSTGFHVLDLK
jgi:hypothetical protein